MAVIEGEGLLVASDDVFRGVTVDPAGLAEDPDTFGARLARSLDAWRDRGYRLVWLEVPIARADLIPVAASQGFAFHHCEPNRITLTRQLLPGVTIPLPATHYVGAGGLVVNSRQELLVVVEKAHRHRQPNYYKLPGGALLPGEHLVDGVMREVREETGIETRFVDLVGFRHWHGYRFGKSDIYFICRLDPLTAEIRIQESEIETCLWMPLCDYLAAESVGIFNKRMVATALGSTGLAPGWFDGYGALETHEIFLAQGRDSESRGDDGC